MLRGREDARPRAGRTRGRWLRWPRGRARRHRPRLPHQSRGPRGQLAGPGAPNGRLMAGGTAPHGLEAALPVARPLPAGGTAPSARRTAKGGGERQPMESKQHAGVPSPSSADASRSGDPRRAERPSPLVRMLRALEAPALVLVPCAMAGCALAGLAQSALVMLLVVVLVLGLFFAGYEASRPGLRQIMPTLVLASLAAAGRILFAAVPDLCGTQSRPSEVY